MTECSSVPFLPEGPVNDRGILLLAIGNSGRTDDGLGWAFAEQVERLPGFRGRVEYRYQLQVEDAELISRYRQVIFVDATLEELPGGYRWSVCDPEPFFSFSTHRLLPATVLHLADTLYGARPEAWLLAIRGAEWGLRSGLGGRAKENLSRALRSWKRRHPENR